MKFSVFLATEKRKNLCSLPLKLLFHEIFDGDDQEKGKEKRMTFTPNHEHALEESSILDAPRVYSPLPSRVCTACEFVVGSAFQDANF